MRDSSGGSGVFSGRGTVKACHYLHDHRPYHQGLVHRPLHLKKGEEADNLYEHSPDVKLR
jgi:hypothetical protein